jgi:hypothetical protein
VPPERSGGISFMRFLHDRRRECRIDMGSPFAPENIQEMHDAAVR